MREMVKLAPLVVTAILFVAVLRSGPDPAPLWRSVRPLEAHDPRHCTWSCHNHGCEHPTRLPDFLSRTLFDRTVLALHSVGGGFAGYRAANLVVFCVLWPALTVWLWLVFLRQRRQLRARSRR